MDILGIVAALAPDHAVHATQEQLDSMGPDVDVKCSCGVRLTFLATEIAKLEPTTKAEIAFQIGTRSTVTFPEGSPADELLKRSAMKGKVRDGS